MMVVFTAQTFTVLFGVVVVVVVFVVVVVVAAAVVIVFVVFVIVSRVHAAFRSFLW